MDMPVIDPLEVFREVTVRLCGNLDLASALAECHVFLKGVLPLDAINLAVYDRGLGAIRFVAGYPNGPDSAGGEVALAGLSRGSRAELEGTALPDVRIVNRPQQDPVSQQVTAFAGDARSISLLIARLVPLAQVMDEHIRRVLEAVEGRVEGPGGAAEVLDMNPSTLRHSMRRLGIPFGRKAK
jgi:hypothetical protein